MVTNFHQFYTQFFNGLLLLWLFSLYSINFFFVLKSFFSINSRQQISHGTLKRLKKEKKIDNRYIYHSKNTRVQHLDKSLMKYLKFGSC